MGSGLSHPPEQGLQVVSQFDWSSGEGSFLVTNPAHSLMSEQDRAALYPCCVWGSFMSSPMSCSGERHLVFGGPAVPGGAHTEDHQCGEMGQSSISSKRVWESSVHLDTGWSPLCTFGLPLCWAAFPPPCSANQKMPVL